MRPVLLALAALVAMEPLTALTHRLLMHGVGLRLHRSHHRRVHVGWELNDLYPLMFAAVVGIGLWVGFHAPAWSDLVPIGVGITLYGVAYATVHDVYIHHRLSWLSTRAVPGLARLAAAHELHHRFGGAPYGMLVPIVPGHIKVRATRADGQAPSGSRPSQVPELA
ncbi:MAG: beta-carotene hydroxylase [Ilumatobacteraceae bacterium]